MLKIAISLYLIFSAVCIHAQFIPDDNRSVVIDTTHNLMWQDQNESYGPDRFNYNRAEGGNAWNFHNAQVYCRNLEYGGYKDWFVPSSDQLESVVEFPYKGARSKSQPSAFKNTDDRIIRYWSSSTAPYRNQRGITCQHNNCYDIEMKSVVSVRCVRNIDDTTILSKE